MEIRVPCPHCGKVLIVPCEGTSKVGVCPSCHQKVIVPPRHPADTPNRAADTLPYLDSNALSGDPPLKSLASSTTSNPGMRIGTQRGSQRPKSTPQQADSNRDGSNDDLQPPKSWSSSTKGKGLIGTLDPLVEKPNAVWFVRGEWRQIRTRNE